MLSSVLLACSLWTGSTLDVPATVVRLEADGVVLDHPSVEDWEPAGAHRVTADPNLARRLRPGQAITARLLLRDGQVRLIGAIPADDQTQTLDHVGEAE